MNNKYVIDLADAVWHKSSHSSATRECVEVAFLEGGLTGVRDSKSPSGPALVFSPLAWTAFTSAVADGELGHGS